MDVSEALYTSLLAIYTADSGSGGLSNTSSTALLKKFVLEGDANYDENRAEQFPCALISIDPRPDNAFGTGNDLEAISFRVKVKTRRDAGRAKQNAILARLKSQFDGIVPANQTGWTFSPMTFEDEDQLLSDSKCLINSLEFSCRGASA